MIEIAILLLLAAISAGMVYYFFYMNKKKTSHQQSILLMENIKKVCKLVTVEGDFVEILTINDTKSSFFNLFNFDKKAVVVIKAKALVGFDLGKAQIELDEPSRTITIHHFPHPEIMSIEPEMNYYDLQDSMFNKFSPSDYSDIHKKTMETFRNKVLESNLPHKAIEQVHETLSTIKQLTSVMDWKFNYQLPKSNVVIIDKATTPKALLSESTTPTTK